MDGTNIFLADGFEDVEALGTCDVLRRGGVECRLVAVTGDPAVRSSHGIYVMADCCISELGTGAEGTSGRDWMIFPGGMPGSRKLAACEPLVEAMRTHYAAGGSLAAICAAPGLVLSRLGGFAGKRFTCFEGFQQALVEQGGIYCPEPAVSDGRIVTGRSAGHALTFALEILSRIKGEEAAENVRRGLYL